MMASQLRITQNDFSRPSSNSSASQDTRRSAAASGGRGNVFGSPSGVFTGSVQIRKQPATRPSSSRPVAINPFGAPGTASSSSDVPSRYAFGANAFAQSMLATPNKTTGATGLAATVPPKETQNDFTMYGDAPATVGAGANANEQAKLCMRRKRCQDLSEQNGLGLLSNEKWEKMGRPKPREFLDGYGLTHVSATPKKPIFSPLRAAASKLSAESPYHSLTPEQRGKVEAIFRKKEEKNAKRRAFLSKSNEILMKNANTEDQLAAQEDQELEEELQMILAPESRDEDSSNFNRRLFSISEAGGRTAEGSREGTSTPGAATASSSSGTAQPNASSSGAANGHEFSEGESAWYSRSKGQMDDLERVTIVKVHYDDLLEAYYDLSNGRQTDNAHLVTIERMEAWKRQGS